MTLTLLQRAIALLERHEICEDDCCLTCGARTPGNHWVKCEWKRVVADLEAEVKRMKKRRRPWVCTNGHLSWEEPFDGKCLICAHSVIKGPETTIKGHFAEDGIFEYDDEGVEGEKG
jgi:hypothetical protein